MSLFLVELNMKVSPRALTAAVPLPYMFLANLKTVDCANRSANEGKISSIRKSNSSVLMYVEGPVHILADVAELLGWMTSAFQTTAGGVLSSLISFGQVPTVNDSMPLFRFSVSGTESPKISGACWLPLVKGSVIAPGFEVPARTGQKGLELSFDDLVAL